MQKIQLFLLSTIALTLSSCARVSLPTGGPKDEKPPVLQQARPANLSTNVSTNIYAINLDFDEYVLVKDVSKQVIISPAPQIFPSIEPTSRARTYVTVKFLEPLHENTTYTINFGSAIADNNEGNKLENFTYVFSTGSTLDSLEVSGKIKASLRKELPEQTLLALYKVGDNDSIDLTKKPYYVTRAATDGNFSLKNLKEGNYRMIAFSDKNSNLMLDPDKEQAGFVPEPITLEEEDNKYNVVLAPVKQPYRAVEAIQDGQGVVKIRFKGEPEEVTVLPLDEKFPPITVEHPKFADSLYVYFDNSKLSFEKKDRIKFTVNHQQKTDTVSALYDNTEEVEFALSVGKKTVTPTQNFVLESPIPLKRINTDSITVVQALPENEEKELNFTAVIDSINTKQLNISFPTDYNNSYTVKLKAAAVTNFLGQSNEEEISYAINVKEKKDYANLTVTLDNKPEGNIFFQLMDEKYNILENIYSDKDVYEFKNQRPGKYMIRILVDSNNNGVWDKEDLQNFIPAEPTHLYPKVIELRAFWDTNEKWIL